MCASRNLDGEDLGRTALIDTVQLCLKLALKKTICVDESRSMLLCD